MITILTSYAMTMILWCLLSEQWNLYKILKICKMNITCNVSCFPRTWRHKTFNFTVLFQTATFEMQRYLFSAYMTSFSAYHFPVFFRNIFIFVTESIFFLSEMTSPEMTSEVTWPEVTLFTWPEVTSFSALFSYYSSSTKCWYTPHPAKGTFCTTTIVRKKRGKWRHFPLWRHLRSRD